VDITAVHRVWTWDKLTMITKVRIAISFMFFHHMACYEKRESERERER